MQTQIELKDYGTRDNWLASRTTALGASEVAALFTGADGQCISPFTTPFLLWLEKTGQQDPAELTAEYVEIGNLVEPVVAELYQRRTGRKVWQGGPFCVAEHPSLSFLRATPDRWVIDAPDRSSPGLLQIKNANAFKVKDWDEGVPDYIEIQVQAEMAVTGREWDSVAVLIGGSSFRSFDVERNPDFIAELIEQARQFWSLVETRTRPDLDASPRTLEAIKRLHPADNGESVRLPEEAISWFETLEETKAGLKQYDAAKILCETKIRDAIGPATFGELPDGRRLSLKTSSNPGYSRVVEPYTYRTLRLEKAPTKGKKK
jgi:putative phage-type endonuclease